jgi:glycerol-3-phosphate dehydrogenase
VESAQAEVDLFVIGGGVNGCGVARDAAGRGYRVALAEKGDLAGGTSSRSTKLVHGGLRYLENYEFRMVREALREREILWRMAPHLIEPLRFVIPVAPGGRPGWLLRLGLALYDHLGAREKLPGAERLDLRRAPEGAALNPALTRGLSYYDCRVDDSRLVVLNARDAADRGAAIFSRTRVVGARVEGVCWRIALRDSRGVEREISARLVVNAAGPWASEALGALGVANAPRLRLVRGSHIVTRKLFDHDSAYLFQAGDGRVVFAIPYCGDFTLIGTTDADFSGPPDEAAITPDEEAYLCRVASGFFARPVTASDIVWSFSGVRPLCDDGGGAAAKASRDYRLDQRDVDGAPLISVFGGKLTAYRRVAEQVVDLAARRLGVRGGTSGGDWTESSVLPGGDLPGGDLASFARELSARYPFLGAATARRMAKAYGTLCGAILGTAIKRTDLGRDFGLGLSEAEVDYLVTREWAMSAEDILWRRSKLGLWASADMRETLDHWLAGRVGAGA